MMEYSISNEGKREELKIIEP